MWGRLKMSFKRSLTILWARGVALIGVLFAIGESVIQDPRVAEAIQSVLRPQFVPYYVIVIGILTELARRRTAGKTQ